MNIVKKVLFLGVFILNASLTSLAMQADPTRPPVGALEPELLGLPRPAAAAARARASVGKVTIVIGTCSSGKSTLVEELDERLGEKGQNAVIIELDDLADEDLEAAEQEKGALVAARRVELRRLGMPLTTLGNFPEAHISRENFAIAKAILENVRRFPNSPIIVDTGIIQKDDVRHLIMLLNRYGISFRIMLLYTPLEVVLERVEERNSTGDPAEMRKPEQPIRQFGHLFVAEERAGTSPLGDSDITDESFACRAPMPASPCLGAMSPEAARGACSKVSAGQADRELWRLSDDLGCRLIDGAGCNIYPRIMHNIVIDTTQDNYVGTAFEFVWRYVTGRALPE